MARGETTAAHSYRNRPRTQPRRKDRRLDDADWQDRLLRMSPVGHLAVVWEGQPLLHSNLYWFDGAHIFMHTAAVGMLRAVLGAGPTRACFTVAEQGRILPAGTPFDFSTEYASVILYGTAEVVGDPAEKRLALEVLMAKYAPHLTAGVDYEPMPDRDIALTSVLRLRVEERVGKHNVKPVDYPAYPYPGGSFIDAERAAGRVTVKAKELA
jgi:nitroimidazol reductase NimA-like FMN-containing flavoprotein (pyridoxamine 5'-phosphate oxidase superfamily)